MDTMDFKIKLYARQANSIFKYKSLRERERERERGRERERERERENMFDGTFTFPWLLWAITQWELVIHMDVSGQPITPFLKGQDCLTVEFESVWMSLNVSKKLQLYAT
jgi:hypothetical protein